MRSVGGGESCWSSNASADGIWWCDYGYSSSQASHLKPDKNIAWIGPGWTVMVDRSNYMGIRHWQARGRETAFFFVGLELPFLLNRDVIFSKIVPHPAIPAVIYKIIYYEWFMIFDGHSLLLW